jgi:hypothetical protein
VPGSCPVVVLGAADGRERGLEVGQDTELAKMMVPRAAKCVSAGGFTRTGPAWAMSRRKTGSRSDRMSAASLWLRAGRVDTAGPDMLSPLSWPVQAFANWAESHSAPGLTRCG